MSELERNRRSSAASRRRAAQSSSRRKSSYSKTGAGTSARRRSSTASRRNNRRRNSTPGGGWWLAIVALVLAVAVISIFFAIKGKNAGPEEGESTTAAVTETTIAPIELEREVIAEGVSLSGMNRDQAKAALTQKYPWGLVVKNGEESYPITNLAEARIDEMLDEVYESGAPKEEYSLRLDGLEEAVTREVEAVAQKWDKKAKNGSISSYDKETGKFVFSGAETGRAVDQEKLKQELLTALSEKNWEAQLTAPIAEVAPEFDEASAKEKYKTLVTFTTNTTANSKRNTNVKLSAQAINGYVLQPGEEFSFNKVVGRRTEEKGYQAAAAYNNGLVVEEIGGGVCQTSTTLYNAVLRAGLKTTVRRSHTFEPSYITPGQDATVSYGGPDYAFVNNSSAAVGILAHYADRKLTISIYGVPVLEPGITYDLQSTKLKDIDVPEPIYEEDQTLQLDEEKLKKEGSKGSYWETRLIIKKEGEVISREVDHNTTYKGHNPVILRNTSGVVIPSSETDESSESIVPSEGAGDGIAPDPDGSGLAVPPASTAPSTAANPGTGENTAPGPGVPAPTTAPSPTTVAPPVTAPAPGPTVPPQTESSQPSAPANPQGGGQTGPGAPIGGPGGGPGESGGDIVAPNPLGGS